MKAVVMAGGFGTRLRPITENLPKPMAYVANRPMMEHVVQLLKRAGITDLEVLLYFYPEKITSYFGSGDPWDVRISYISAETDYGTAGAVKNAEDRIDGTFLVISADIITDIDLSRAIEFHRDRKAAATIVLTRVPNPLQYGIVITEDDASSRRGRASTSARMSFRRCCRGETGFWDISRKGTGRTWETWMST
jgi:mannose-1-phosphate guanylyltransferase/phosphomannomutase